MAEMHDGRDAGGRATQGAVVEDEAQLAKNRRRALRTVALLAVVALAFYVGIFLIVSWRHP